MIQEIHHYLTFDQTNSIVHAYVTSKQDGNNALLGGHVESWKGLKGQTAISAKRRYAVDQKYMQIMKYDPVTQHLHELH